MRGRAEQVRHTASWFAGYACVLRVAGTPVQVLSAVPIRIDEGDHVAVAGYERDGALAAVAFANASTGAAWDVGSARVWAGAALCVAAGGHLAVGVWMLTLAGDLPRDLAFRVLPGAVLFLLAVALGAAGAWSLRRGLQVRAARRGLAAGGAADAGR